MSSCSGSEQLIDSYGALLSASRYSKDRDDLSLCFFGDSHVSRMQKAYEDASCSNKIEFISVSGLCMRDTAHYLDRLRNFDIVIVQCGGNDVSFHPKKPTVIPDYPVHLSQSFKSFADDLGQKTKLKIMQIITRPKYHIEIENANFRLKKRFRSCFVPSSINLDFADATHLTKKCYLDILNEALAQITE